jgi:YegS/Rv2252/BmrU family lipid kinase
MGKSHKKPLRAKFIFNPTAGKENNSPQQLLAILSAMTKYNIVPEVNILDRGEGIKAVIERAKEDGTKLIVASGGDGTVDSVAAELAGTSLTLGILPTGTANNLALNFRIPRDLEQAVALLREGTRVKVDMGKAETKEDERYFMELLTIGLLSDIFPSADDFRHGDLMKAGDVISTFASSTPSEITLELDGHKPKTITAYSVIVTNMPYIGNHFRLSRSVSFRDQKLDVFVFTELSKVRIVNDAIRYMSGEVNDASVKHFRVQKARISSNPPMAINLDGRKLEGVEVKIKAKSKVLHVMAGTEEEFGPPKHEVAELIKPATT